MKFRLTHLSIAVVFFASAASSQTVAIDVTVPEIGHESFGNYGIDHLVGSYYGSPDWSSFNASLTAADKLVFKLAAPTGYVFNYTPAAESIGAALWFGETTWRAPNATGGGLSVSLPVVVSLDGYTGRQPDRNSIIVRVSGDRRSVSLEGNLSLPAEAMSFSGFTVTADLSRFDTSALPAYTYTPNAFGARFQDIYRTSIPDPGPALSITAAVPEPGTYAMLLAGLTAVCVVSRRRCNRPAK